MIRIAYLSPLVKILSFEKNQMKICFFAHLFVSLRQKQQNIYDTRRKSAILAQYS